MPDDYVLQELEEHVLVHLAGLDRDSAQLTTMRKAFVGELRIEFSLSHCQGDGVALYGRIYRDEAPQLAWADNVEYLRLERNEYGRHYTHYNTFSIMFYDEDDNLLAEGYTDRTVLFIDEDGKHTFMGTSWCENMSKTQYEAYNKMEDTVMTLRNLCRDLERVGYQSIDDYVSDERIVEILNEYDARKYDEHGNVVELLWWQDDIRW